MRHLFAILIFILAVAIVQADAAQVSPAAMRLTTVVPATVTSISLDSNFAPVTNYSVTVAIGYTNVCPGSNYEVYATINLASADAWTCLGTFTATARGGAFYLTNRPWPMEFYRIRGFQNVPPPVYVVVRTVPVGHEPYLLFTAGTVTAACVFYLIRHLW